MVLLRSHAYSVTTSTQKAFRNGTCVLPILQHRLRHTVLGSNAIAPTGRPRSFVVDSSSLVSESSQRDMSGRQTDMQFTRIVTDLYNVAPSAFTGFAPASGVSLQLSLPNVGPTGSHGSRTRLPSEDDKITRMHLFLELAHSTCEMFPNSSGTEFPSS